MQTTFLSKEENRLVNESWKRVRVFDSTFEDSGVMLFKNLFRINPELKYIFANFEAENINVYESRRLIKTGASILSAIDRSVRNL